VAALSQEAGAKAYLQYVERPFREIAATLGESHRAADHS
jgi:hypothetical protein